MLDTRSCGQCGAPLPPDGPAGVCPSCLMRLGFESHDASGTKSHAAGRSQFVPPKARALAAHFPQLEILDLIGQGGMGAVYKARQVGLDRVVALKILPPHAGDDGSFAGRFEREARSLARLSHPNIITVFDSGRAGDFYYFVMEFVDGVNLREAIGAGTLAPAEALAIVPQICDALQYAHDEGIVHRDIKPENVLIDKKGNTKIADFGLARLLGPTTDLTLTGTHQVMGTPRYMAPEQMEGSHEVDHRADIYSLGVVFYEMLTGELPMGRFDGPSKKVQIDVRLDEVVFRTLEKEPDRRYQHASEIKTDVQTICGLHGGSARYGGSPRHVGSGHVPHYEYKSRLQLFGWPLVHIAYGIDPKTGNLHRAKGIIAMGNVAMGVIAIGTYAVGGIAIGGFALGGLSIGGGTIGSLAIGGASLGLFAFGGIAIGLLMAGGGVALGFGLSFGGLALGMVAQGQVAVGWLADADQGSAYGIHAIGANAWDGKAERFFSQNIRAQLILASILFIASVTFSIATLISIRLITYKKSAYKKSAYKKSLQQSLRSVEHPQQPARVARNTDPTTRRSIWTVVVAIGVICGLMAICVLPLLVIGYTRLALQEDLPATISWSEPASQPIETGQRDVERPPSADAIGWIIWTEDGPTLDPQFGYTGQTLGTEQIADINQVLRDVHAAYLQLEQKYLKQERTAAGHWITTVEFTDTGELAQLENRIWTEIDALVDVSWQEQMRAHLNFQTPGDLGVIGFEDQRGKIEIWKVGSWFHWQLTTKSAPASRGMMSMVGGSSSMSRGMGGMPSGFGPGGVPGGFGVQGPEHRGPELPLRFRRFWQEPDPNEAEKP